MDENLRKTKMMKVLSLTKATTLQGIRTQNLTKQKIKEHKKDVRREDENRKQKPDMIDFSSLIKKKSSR